MSSDGAIVYFVEANSSEDENLPSMDTLEVSNKSTIQSIPSYFGGGDEDDIPDMAEYEEFDNVIEMDPVSFDWNIKDLGFLRCVKS